MPQTYYIDGTTLSNSTAIYTDIDLTICAPDGFYSDGINSRELVNCVLLPSQACGECATPCGQPITASGNQGIYRVNLDAGNSIGAMLVKFNPASIPDGIRVLYDGGVYNKLSSPVDGYHASTNATSYTYVGATTSDCGISGTTYPSLAEYEYNGSAFVATGNTQSVTVASGDVSLGAAPGLCVMVIPKINPSPSLVQVEVVGPCSSTAWTLDISCPAPLTGFYSSPQQAACSEACGHPQTEYYYNAPVTGSSGIPALHDWVFEDENGEFLLPDGYYGVNAGDCMQVQDGVVVSMTTCSTPPPPTEYIYLSTIQSTCNTFCGGPNYTIVTQVTTLSNHSWANITLGDIIAGPTLTDGYYAYAASPTDTDTGVYRIMYILSNYIENLLECDGQACIPL